MRMSSITPRTILVYAALFAAVAGCAGRKQNVSPYQNVTSVEAFVGDYENIGQPHVQSAPAYLSALIFRGEHLNHSQKIQTIQVRSQGNGRLLVRGLGTSGEEVKSGTFLEGKDFWLNNGVVAISSSTSAGTAMPLLPAASARYDHVTLGLDRDGNAQQVTETMIGGVLVVIPFGGSDSSGKHFRRIKAPASGEASPTASAPKSVVPPVVSRMSGP